MALDPELLAQINKYIADQRAALEPRAAGNIPEGNAEHKNRAHGEAWRALDQLNKNAARLLPELENYGIDLNPSHRRLIEGALGGDAMSDQALVEMFQANKQRLAQNTQLEDYRTKAATEMLGAPGNTVDQAMANSNSWLAQLNNFLGTQQSDVFQKEMDPLIRENLISQGIGDSGARVELNAKALAGLERSRQEQIFGAAMGAKQDILNLERTDLLGDVGAQQAALANTWDLQRTGITMAFQRQLEAERAQLARELAGRKGGGGQGGMIGMGAGAAIGGGLGMMVGGPMGAMMGASLGSSLGGSIGNYADPNANYGALSGIPNTMMAGAGFLGQAPAARTPQTGQFGYGSYQRGLPGPTPGGPGYWRG